MRLVNLTPHAIVLQAPGGERTTIVPSGQIARVASTPAGVVGEVGGVPIHAAPIWGDVLGLPDPEGDAVYIVSALVAGRVAGRQDVVSPGTGPGDGAIRSAAGQIEAVTRLIRA